VIGGSPRLALVANWLAAAWDQNAGLVVSSPVAAALCAFRSIGIAGAP
jgi:hypothetical protein